MVTMTTQTDSELIVLLFELVILITVTFRKFINAYLVLFNLLQNLQTFHTTTYTSITLQTTSRVCLITIDYKLPENIFGKFSRKFPEKFPEKFLPESLFILSFL